MDQTNPPQYPGYGPPQAANTGVASSQAPSYGVAQPTLMQHPPSRIVRASHISQEQAQRDQTPRSKKAWTAVKVLVMLQCGCVFFLLVLGAICVGTEVSHPPNYILDGIEHTGVRCPTGSPIWAGLAALIACCFGLGAVFSPCGNKCLLITYFVLGVLVVLVLISLEVVFGATSFNDDSLIYQKRLSGWELSGTMLVLNSLTIFLGFFCMVSVVVSLVVCCLLWCEGSGGGGCCGGCCNCCRDDDQTYVTLANT